DEIVTSLAWLSAKGLHIPCLCFGNFTLLQEKMNVFVADRDLLVLVFQDLDADTVRSHDESLVLPIVVAWKHLHPRGFPLRNALLNVVHDEADMIDNGPFGPALSLSIPEVQIDIESGDIDQRVSAR